MPAKKQQPLRIGMIRTSIQNGVKVRDQLQATVRNGKQVARWVRISPRPQRDIMDLDVGGLEGFETQKDILDMDGGIEGI